ncbi:MAG: VCBS repeat-containing protein [Deltaproteobacteria bacterium]|nr:VCBS repeat-containing protein [Deltaproteobacteria bacterium]
MRIATSDIQMASRHAAVSRREVRTSSRVWIGERRPNFEGSPPPLSPSPANSTGAGRLDTVHLSKAALEAKRCNEVTPADTEVSSEDETKMALIVSMVEILTGKKLKLFSPKEFTEELERAQRDAESTSNDLNEARAGRDSPARGRNDGVRDPVRTTEANRAEAGSPSSGSGFGVEFDYYERQFESEKTVFTADGVMRTRDGKEVSFSVNVGLSREFMREQSISLRAGDAVVKDPLVLNFGGSAAELTSTRFNFDIDSDGRSDQIAFVGPNSGFLALDRNVDGVINDGTELFGARTGDGFAELAAYDEDNNQWIDENDSIYEGLRIWSKDGEGRDSLQTLGQRGVGAIYLGHVATPFSLKDGNNELQGQIQATGLFLEENGSPGTVQQIDLVV